MTQGVDAKRRIVIPRYGGNALRKGIDDGVSFARKGGALVLVKMGAGPAPRTDVLEGACRGSAWESDGRRKIFQPS